MNASNWEGCRWRAGHLSPILGTLGIIVAHRHDTVSLTIARLLLLRSRRGGVTSTRHSVPSLPFPWHQIVSHAVTLPIYLLLTCSSPVLKLPKASKYKALKQKLLSTSGATGLNGTGNNTAISTQTVYFSKFTRLPQFSGGAPCDSKPYTRNAC